MTADLAIVFSHGAAPCANHNPATAAAPAQTATRPTSATNPQDTTPTNTAAATASHGGTTRRHPMAKVAVQRTWPDGENLLVEITVANSFPDVVAEARQAALRAFEDALAITLAHDTEDDEA